MLVAVVVEPGFFLEVYIGTFICLSPILRKNEGCHPSPGVKFRRTGKQLSVAVGECLMELPPVLLLSALLVPLETACAQTRQPQKCLA